MEVFVKTRLLRYIELILTAAGLVIIFALVAALPDSASNKWFIVACVAVVVGALHGAIFFLVRNRQRKVREEAIAEVSAMLQDMINNQMTVIRNFAGSDDAKLREVSDKAVMNISLIVGTLSEDSLRSWKERYREILKFEKRDK